MSYIKLDRALNGWRYKTMPNYVALWVHLLVNANYKDKEWQDIIVRRGQFVTSIESLSKGTGISRQTVRTILNKLNGQELTCKSTNKYTLITIVKYDYYQSEDDETNTQTNNQLTNNQQTTNKQLTTTKEVIRKKRNKEYIYMGDYKNVKLTSEQLEKLKTEFPNDYQEWINRVDTYCQSKGKKYNDYLATIRNWARKDNSVKQPEDIMPVYTTDNNKKLSNDEINELLKLKGK